MARRPFTLLAAIIALVLLAGACSSSGSGASEGSGPSGQHQASSVPAAGGSGPAGTAATDKARHYKIDIALIAQIDMMNKMVDNFKAKLKSLGYTNVSYTERNANGNTQNVSLIVKQMVGDKPDLIYAIGTPLVVGFMHAKPSIPVLFGAITDPVGAHFVNSLEHPGGDFTGTSDVVVVQDTFKILHQVLPNAKRIGVVGKISDQNTASEIAKFKKYASGHGYTIKVSPVTTTADLQLAIKSLAGKVDALLVGTDNTVASAIKTAGQAAAAAKLPFVMAAGVPPTSGLLLTFGANYPQLGTANGAQAAKILQGTAPASIPVVTPETVGYDITVDTATAKTLGISIPSKILGIAPKLAAK